MGGLLPLGFASPLALAGLLLLPVIWWLLRLLPPSPRRVAFPPARLLEDIGKREETPDTSPLWLTILRLLLATALILALAGPQWRPGADAPSGEGPLWILLDNGWAASADWETRRGAAERLVASAAEQGRPVLLAATAEGPDQPLVAQDARSVVERLRAMEPRPWPTSRGELTIALRKAANIRPPGALVWFSDDVAQPTSARFVEDLRSIAGQADLVVYRGLGHPPVLAGARNDPEALTASVIPSTAAPADAQAPRVRAFDEKGLLLGETVATAGATEGLLDMRLELPVELRNDVARLEIDGARSAAAVQLLDDRWQRRTVGLVSGASSDQAQPLLSPLYYLERALSPFAELRHAREADVADAVEALISQGVSVLVMADVGRLSEPAGEALRRWIEQGGVLVRFAGPRLAGGSDDLVPTGCARATALWAARCPGRNRSRLQASPRARPSRACRPLRRDRLAAGAGGTGPRPDRQELGPACRRHAAGHGQHTRAWNADPLSCHRGRKLVEPSAVRHLRGDAAPDHRPLRDTGS